jgi:AraC-like DNA-binding protein
MKPVLEHLPLKAKESFVVKYFDYPYYPTPWHFHPEYELVLVTESTGKRFVGDSVTDFKPGNLAFIGPNLPHLYRNDAAYYKPNQNMHASSIVIHFLETSFGENFLSLPETKKLSKLFAKSTRGLEVTGKTNTIISKKMHDLCHAEGLTRWIGLLEILDILSASKEVEYISNEVVQGRNETESGRLNTVIEFVMKNFKREIMTGEAAALVNMAQNSFSRYFTQRTRKTFTAFVNEMRLNHACKLLAEGSTSITDICFECGFNNLSNFNRQFKAVYHVSPLNYRKTLTEHV